MPYEISTHGFIRASERCAELRNVLDGMKMAMQFSSLCFCLLFVSVPPHRTLPFCQSYEKHHFPSTYQHISLSHFPPASLKISFMLWSTKVTHLTPCCRDCRSSFTSPTKSHQSRKLFSLCEWQGNYRAEWHEWRSAFTPEAIATAETTGRKAVTDIPWLIIMGLV